MAKRLPIDSICTIKGAETKPADFIISRFGQHLGQRNYLPEPHGHSFYRLGFFTIGAGKQTIDFTSFPVKPGQIYFMNPGQVHSCKFSGEVDGYIVNFSESFFDSFFKEPNYLDRFPFFGGLGEDQVIPLTDQCLKEVTELFERLLIELNPVKTDATEMIRTLLLQLFITVTRQPEPVKRRQLSKPGFTTFRNFQKLVNEHYLTLRLPSEYAARLYVTPNYLNALCRDLLGKSAGEIIRDRIILEARRLLVNADTSIREIAMHLNFEDNSYFSKFFRKYVGKTPEEFRRQHRIGFTNN